MTMRKIPDSFAVSRQAAAPMIIKQAMSARCLASFTRKAAPTQAETWNRLYARGFASLPITILESL